MKKSKIKGRRAMALVLALMLCLNPLIAFAEEGMDGITEEILIQEQSEAAEPAAEPVQEQPEVSEAAAGFVQEQTEVSEPAAEPVQETTTIPQPEESGLTEIQAEASSEDVQEFTEDTADQEMIPEQVNTFAVSFQVNGTGSGTILVDGQPVNAASFVKYVQEGSSFSFSAVADEGSQVAGVSAGSTGGNGYSIPYVAADTMISVTFQAVEIVTADPAEPEDTTNEADDPNAENAENGADDADQEAPVKENADQESSPNGAADQEPPAKGEPAGDPVSKAPTKAELEEKTVKDSALKAPAAAKEADSKPAAKNEKSAKTKKSVKAAADKAPSAVQKFLDAVQKLEDFGEITEKNMEEFMALGQKAMDAYEAVQDADLEDYEGVEAALMVLMGMIDDITGGADLTAAKWHTITLVPASTNSYGSKITSAKVRVGQRVNGYEVTSVSGTTIKVKAWGDLYGDFFLPRAADLWNGAVKSDYVIWAGIGSSDKTEGAWAMLPQYNASAYYYFNTAGSVGMEDVDLWKFRLKYERGLGNPISI